MSEFERRFRPHIEEVRAQGKMGGGNSSIFRRTSYTRSQISYFPSP